MKPSPQERQTSGHFLSKEVKSFGYAFKGIWQVFRHERHMQIHALAALLVLLAGWYLGLSGTEWCLVIFAIGLVMVAETFNSAIEQLTNIISPQFNPLAGRVKDIAAGAVLMAAITAAAIGCLVFSPKIWALLTP